MPSTIAPLDVERLRDLMILAGHSQASLADACEPPLSKATLSHLLSGNRNASPKVAKRLADALGVPMTELLK